ncbi:MAG: SGNH/GDSL hydrolase family protein [Planctomycetaceae bacterium]|nr:SGNH/GDSL hydrolase family protein [Planctomycetaceae bacterium]
MSLRYLAGAAITVPLLPLMYLQGRRIRAAVPELPEATGPSGTSGQQSSRPFHLVSLGESTVAGVGVATHEQGLTGHFARRLSSLMERPVHWDVFARSGYTASRAASGLIPRIPQRPTDLVLIGLGGNDAFSLRSPERFVRDMQTAIDAVRERLGSVPILIASLPPIGDFPAFPWLIRRVMGGLIGLYCEQLHAAVAQLPGVEFCEERVTFASWIEKYPSDLCVDDFFSDGVHPSEVTYQSWGEDLADAVIARGLLCGS